MIIPRVKATCVYIHYKGETPVYVGMGTEERPFRPEHRAKYEYDGIRIVADGLPREEAKKLEKELIEKIGIENLANVGIGTTTGNYITYSVANQARFLGVKRYTAAKLLGL